MASVQEHYATHLAPLYTWMAGGAAGPRRRFAELCAGLELQPTHAGATALDLGAGNGFQSVPLAEAGYHVTAVDLSDDLLAELQRESGHLHVKAVCGDLRDLTRHAPSPAPEVIVCMGDTLTHLESLDEVAAVLQDAAEALSPGGHLLLSFRDYTSERRGTDRFVPVRSDDDRILTCFLEYGPTHLEVHDVVHTRRAGDWHMAVSSYQKIRLAPIWVMEQLATVRLSLIRQIAENGLVTLVARRAFLA